MKRVKTYAPSTKLYTRKKKIDQGVSPSTLYEVQFKKNTTYKGVPITNAVFKVFKGVNITTYYEKRLIQEVLFYKHIIAPVMDENLSPHFVRYIGSSVCEEDDGEFHTILAIELWKDDVKTLLRMTTLPDQLPDDMKSFMDNGREKFLQARKKLLNKRAELLDKLNDEGDSPQRDKIQEKFEAELQRAKCIYPHLRKSNIPYYIDRYSVIVFHLLCAQYVMDCVHMNHNDLHLNNVLIRTLNEPKIIKYVYGTKTFVIKTLYDVAIIDFDKSDLKAWYDGIPYRHECSVYRTINELDGLYKADICRFQYAELRKILQNKTTLNAMEYMRQKNPQWFLPNDTFTEYIYICNPDIAHEKVPASIVDKKTHGRRWKWASLALVSGAAAAGLIATLHQG